MNEQRIRARNAMIGLAIGDAISWTGMFHRSFLLPQWTRRIRREIDSSSETKNVIVTPMPFSLNQNAGLFNISPTNAAEWAAFTTEILLASDFNSYQHKALMEWSKLANSNEKIRGSVGVKISLNNLKKGIQPPQSGSENPHYFDDSALPRAVPIGIFYTGQSDKAAKLAEIDASITNSEDGIWAAMAMAAAVSLACSGEKIHKIVDIAYSYLPKTSWIRRTVEDALLITKESKTIFSSLPEFQNEIVNHEYSYGNVSPETLALSFSIAQLHSNDFETAVMVASNFAKSSETLPAIVGALVGAMQSTKIESESWLNSIIKLKGICIPSLAGKDYISLVEHFLNLAGNHSQ